ATHRPAPSRDDRPSHGEGRHGIPSVPARVELSSCRGERGAMTKPVILAVDDDHEVLGAIERDLRQKYRDQYRIVAAPSGEQALEAARELKRRGTPIALFVVDQRMPDMTGTDFLKEARTLHPDAKRTLLTAYADSEAAIAAINAVGLD